MVIHTLQTNLIYQQAYLQSKYENRMTFEIIGLLMCLHCFPLAMLVM